VSLVHRVAMVDGMVALRERHGETKGRYEDGGGMLRWSREDVPAWKDLARTYWAEQTIQSTSPRPSESLSTYPATSRGNERLFAYCNRPKAERAPKS